MRVFLSKYLLIIILLMAAASQAFSGEGLTSTMQNVSAYFDYYGYSIRPIGTTTTPGDDGPTQLFEVVRPSNCAITLGRLYTSCTCIQVTTNKKSYVAGETALLTVRNVRPTSGNTYPFYVQMTSPTRVILRYDTYVISDKYAVSIPPVTASLSEPETTTHSPAASTSEIEIIVPTYEAEAVSEQTADAAEANEMESEVTAE